MAKILVDWLIAAATKGAKYLGLNLLVSYLDRAFDKPEVQRLSRRWLWVMVFVTVLYCSRDWSLNQRKTLEVSSSWPHIRLITDYEPAENEPGSFNSNPTPTIISMVGETNLANQSTSNLTPYVEVDAAIKKTQVGETKKPESNEGHKIVSFTIPLAVVLVGNIFICFTLTGSICLLVTKIIDFERNQLQGKLTSLELSLLKTPQAESLSQENPSAKEDPNEKTKRDSIIAESIDFTKIIRQCGLISAFRAKIKHPACQQSYAGDMCACAAGSSTVRILTIAGYEWIGKGQDSLFYTIFAANPNLRLEVILLDPDRGDEVMEKRVNQLRARDETYSKKKMKEQMKQTKAMLKQLFVRNKNIQLWYTKIHPAFRLVIANDCVFVSGYSDSHGHESPVFQIARAKTGEVSDHEVSWYPSFEEYFDNLKLLSTKQSL